MVAELSQHSLRRIAGEAFLSRMSLAPVVFPTAIWGHDLILGEQFLKPFVVSFSLVDRKSCHDKLNNSNKNRRFITVRANI